MRAIEVDDGVAATIEALSNAWAVPTADVVSRLLTAFLATTAPSTTNGSQPLAATATGHEVFCLYAGTRVCGRFDAATQALTITDGALAGQTFRSPSEGARAVVNALKPGVNANRNGWTFWRVTNGDLLDVLRTK
ncbi:flagellar motor protein MotB [Nocardia transvalensis]|uniref:Flagellar motor protein MotB n=1 Tax=Nocardia transvalensis TaxID=37333 RepID=A0A7W9UGC6_9NOCA|nr:hypothetical protein [Nocardia transvalensis]MBB5911565.1 flagellar motor protein MotB [Nocardia transvalensis]